MGDIQQEKAVALAKDLASKWPVKNVKIPEVSVPKAPEQSQVYFYNVPGAKQSVLMFGYPALAETNADYYPATIMNYRLGGGGFASQLTQELREGKGYTYGIRSGFKGSTYPGPFVISSGVRSNITYEATSLVKQILENYPDSFDQQHLEVTKGFMIKSNARKFETMGSKLNMLRDMSNYDWKEDFVKQQEETVKEITVEQIKELARQYVNPGKMYYLIVEVVQRNWTAWSS